ncbi:MAG: hypothetical protein L3K08_01065 [Thermoplasmata archaeon]|nr:hypothetical protein [Thermoplasmata archaeon]
MHVDVLGRFRWRYAPGAPVYLVLTNQRLIVVVGPGAGQRSFRPGLSTPLEAIQQISFHEGTLSSVVSVNGHEFEASHLSRDVPPGAIQTFRDKVHVARSARIAEVRALARLPPPPPPPPLPPVPPPPPAVIREREIYREIVKVPCRFCQQLVLVTDPKCPSCGAPLR